MTTLIPKFQQPLTNSVNRAFNLKLNETVSVKDFGATGDGTTDDTTAIINALATGKSILFPAGTYMTTGGHRLSTNKQFLIGNGAVIIKRLSGVSYLLDTTQGAQVGIENITFDGNALGGSLIIWRGHYSSLNNVEFKNQGGTSYALWISGCNVSTFNNLNFNDTCYGGIKFDNDNDTYVPKPDYACLYSTFSNVAIGTTLGGSSIYAAPVSSIINIDFNSCLIEANNGGITSSILLDGQTQRNITFNDLRGEYSALGAFPYISISGDESVDIAFINGNLTSNAANTAPVIASSTYVRGLTIDNVFFTENGATPSLAGRKLVDLSATRNVSIRNNITRFINNFVFVESLTASSNSYITVQNNHNNIINLGADGNFAGVGTLTLQGEFIDVSSSNMLNSFVAIPYSAQNISQQQSVQGAGTITVADDGYYDVHGTGGVSAAGDFAGVLNIFGASAISATSQNNFAQFYAQTGSSVGFPKSASISVGSNVEILTQDNAVAALANTTDGKLGVQIGYAAAGPNRYVRIYNRTGASVELKVNLLSFL